MPRATKVSERHNYSLPAQLENDATFYKQGRVSKSREKKRAGTDVAEDIEAILDSKSSQKILALAREQQDEIDFPEATAAAITPRGWQPRVTTLNFANTSTGVEDRSDDSENDTDEIDEEALMEDVDADDIQTLDTLLPPSSGQRKTLADLIFAKLEDSGNFNDQGSNQNQIPPSVWSDELTRGLDPRIVDVYTKIGLYLHKYRSGSLPKLLKILPSHAEWSRMLALTSPQDWSPAATSKATKLFISGLKPEQAKVYLEGVLLDAARQDIRENGKLNHHYYEALKRSVFKPAAFFKGIVFPLCERSCTLKEACIFGSVIAKMRIPMLHCAAALHRIAFMDYSGPNSLFIRLLLDKKYALPYKVLDSLFEHFVRLSNTYKGSKSRGESLKLPVLWHQSLLVFCQRYSCDLTQDQKNALLDVVRVTVHPLITPEVRRELVQSVARGEPRLIETT